MRFQLDASALSAAALAVLSVAVALSAQAPAASHPPSSSAAQSGGVGGALARIAAYEHSRGPYQDVTLSSAEANAYFAGPGKASLPKGVSDLQMRFEPGVVIGTATVDFDRLPAAANLGYWQYLFRGTHRVEAHARLDSGRMPRAHFTITEVALDGIAIPNSLIDLAIDAFVRPRHPDVGRRFSVPLPKHAESVSIGQGLVVLHYPGGQGG